MNITELFTILALILSVSAVLAVVKYIIATKQTQYASYSALFIDMINAMKYKRAVMGNDYPVYTGDLENNDTEEYIDFLKSGILGAIRSEDIA